MPVFMNASRRTFLKQLTLVGGAAVCIFEFELGLSLLAEFYNGGKGTAHLATEAFERTDAALS